MTARICAIAPFSTAVWRWRNCCAIPRWAFCSTNTSSGWPYHGDRRPGSVGRVCAPTGQWEDRGAGQSGPLRPVAHLESFARIGNDAYGLVALVLHDKLGAGLDHAGHRHVYGLSVRTGPHHCLYMSATRTSSAPVGSSLPAPRSSTPESTST